MTLIVCYSNSHVDNIASGLRLQPDELILIGSDETMEFAAPRYEDVLRQRGIHTHVTFTNVGKKDPDTLCAALKQLVLKEDDCVIDLTGGEAPVILAVGVMLAGLSQEQRDKLQVERYDHRLGAVLDCLNNDMPIPYRPVTLTVRELIRLHGGLLHPESYQPPEDFRLKDLEGLWDVVSELPKDWNKSIMILSEFESHSESKTDISLSVDSLRDTVTDFPEKETLLRELLDKLHSKGVVRDRSNHYQLQYDYLSPVLRYCTQKAGNVLEIKTLLEGRALTENGIPFFQDCVMGVTIDWDGIVHDPLLRVPETRNEIDVILMHGTTPLFISCKNGNIGEDELYKLHTVAARFGGPRCRKMLIATDMDQKNPSSKRAFVQRAWDMDVFLVTDAAELNDEEWQQIFLKAIAF